MNRTVIMLAVIATFLLTWVLLASFGALITDNSFKFLMTDTGIVLCMFTFGWISAIIVGIDLDERLEQ